MIYYKFVISLVNDKTRCVTTANGNDSKFERRKGSADSINYTDVTSRFLVRTVRVIFTTKTSACFRRQKVMILFLYMISCSPTRVCKATKSLNA